MRVMMACAAALLATGAGCDRSNFNAPLRPVRVTLFPDERTCSVESQGLGPDSPPEDSLTHGSRDSTGAKGEWSVASTISTNDRRGDPHIVMRFFDAGRKAVRVEVTYKGPPPPRLRTLVFLHVAKSEEFRLMTASGEADYKGYSQKGEELHLNWPESADGTVTFLAWPHVH